MKTQLLIIISFMCFVSFDTQAQLNFSWAKNRGTIGGSDRGKRIDSAPDGTIFWAFSENYNTIIHSYDTLGNLIDSLVLGDNTEENVPDLRDIGFDGDGNLFICGAMEGTIDFDPSANIDSITVPDNSVYSFIAKYNQSLQLLWVKKITCNYGIEARDLVIDNNGDLFITGDFTGTSNFNDNGQAIFSSNEFKTNAFIAKYTGSGAYAWAKVCNSDGNTNSRSIDLDSNGNIYLTGHFLQTANFNPDGTANLTSITPFDFDIFIAKYTNTGGYTNAIRIGGNESDLGLRILIKGNDLTITGNFKDTVDFNPGNATNLFYGNIDNNDATFIAKYDLDFNYQWAKSIISTQYMLNMYSVLDGYGNIYISGYFSETCNFSPLTLTSSGDLDGYYAKYSPTGDLIWADKVGGGISGDNCFAIFATNTKFYITGEFNATVDFDPDPNDEFIIDGGLADAYLVQFGDNTTGINHTAISTNINVYPNPANANITIKLADHTGKQTFTLTNILGNIVFSQLLTSNQNTVAINTLSAGIYIWHCGNNTGKLIIE